MGHIEGIQDVRGAIGTVAITIIVIVLASAFV
jgi:hypothetical protein